METMNEEEVFDGKLWDDVMFDMFSQAKSEEDIDQELDDIWNDFDQDNSDVYSGIDVLSWNTDWCSCVVLHFLRFDYYLGDIHNSLTKLDKTIEMISK